MLLVKVNGINMLEFWTGLIFVAYGPCCVNCTKLSSSVFQFLSHFIATYSQRLLSLSDSLT